MQLQCKKSTKSLIAVAVLGVALFAVFSFLFPYTGDDWAWGSSIGIDRLNTFFYNYNGRYLGNLLVLSITRNRILRVFTMVLSYFAACWLGYKYTENKSSCVLLLSFVLFFAMPQGVFKQAVIWTAGFSNYVPSAVLSLLYIYIIRNITSDVPINYGKYTFICTFFIGLFGSLFIENITLFNIALAVAVSFYALLKFKKFYLTHLSFFVGSILGAVIMFTNESYHSIAVGKDTYRSTVTSLKELLTRAITHSYHSLNFLVISNALLCIFITSCLCVLTYRLFKRFGISKCSILGACSTFLNILTLGFIVVKNYTNYAVSLSSFNFINSKRLQTVVAILYALSVLVTTLVGIEKGKRFKVLLPLYCVPVMVLPLLVVTPIGPRCFFAPYLMLMVFSLNVFSYIIQDISYKFEKKAVFSGLLVVLVLQSILYSVLLFPIHSVDVKRNAFAKLQSDNGEKIVSICALPNEPYLHVSSPTVEPWITRYKLFYGLDSDVTFNFVSEKELDKIIEKYNKQK